LIMTRVVSEADNMSKRTVTIQSMLIQYNI